jgi:hypothetical protein
MQVCRIERLFQREQQQQLGDLHQDERSPRLHVKKKRKKNARPCTFKPISE